MYFLSLTAPLLILFFFLRYALFIILQIIEEESKF